MRLRILLATSLALLVLIVFGRTAQYGFVDFDDDAYVFRNDVVQQGLSAAGIKAALTTERFSNWHPLTTLSYQLDRELDGPSDAPPTSPDAPRGRVFHATNVLLHAVNVLLLFGLLLRTTGAPWRSALAAALFAVHPLNVEPVAWIASRKDLLCATFGFAALHAYAGYARRPSVARMAAVVGCLLASLLAKETFLVLPALLLVLDFWPLGRCGTSAAEGTAAPDADTSTAATAAPVPRATWRRLVLEKLPVAVIVLAFAGVGIGTQARAGSTRSLAELPLSVRLRNLAPNYAWYLRKGVVPTGLSAFHAHPSDRLPGGTIAAAAGALVLSSWLAWRVRRIEPAATAGWCWYLFALVPMAGFVQIGNHWVAERYAYLPTIGLFVAFAWGLGAIGRALHVPRPATGLVGAALVVAAAVVSFAQAGTWRDTRTLWTHALEVEPETWFAHQSLGQWYFDRGDLGHAADHVQSAIEGIPTYWKPYFALGLIALAAERPDAAVAPLERARALQPESGPVRVCLADAYRMTGRTDEAAGELERALAFDPQSPEIRVRCGRLALEDRDRPAEAAAHFEAMIAATGPHPQVVQWLVESHLRAGRRLLEAGRAAEAAPHVRRARELAPGNAEIEELARRAGAG